MDSATVVIHGRFAPNGVVSEMGERPAHLSPQQWFDTLSRQAADAYRPLAGGRITFRLTRERIAAIAATAA